MFWGLIMEPNKRYSQVVDKPFHLSMASLDASTASGGLVQVMINYDERNYLLCTLQKDNIWQVPLDLNFEEGTKVSFTCNGDGHVHLTGFLIPEDEDLDLEDDEDEEEEDEVPPTLVCDKKRKAKENAKDQNNKRAKISNNVSDEDDSEDSDSHFDSIMDSDDSDDDLKTDTDSDNIEDSDDEDGAEEDEDDEEEEEEEPEKVEQVKPSKKEKQKQNKQKIEQKQNNHQQQNQSQQQNKDKKDKKEKNKDKNKMMNGQQEKSEKEQPKQKKNKNESKSDDSKVEQQQQQKKRTVEGGVQVQDVKVGNGAPAKSGKFVSVYYVGRLKNGKKFDSTQQGEGFKFRLGKGEVIKGWDVGVAGMKVGGKRILNIPPHMAYGAKGSPPVIPPNSHLTFEVELKSVH